MLATRLFYRTKELCHDLDPDHGSVPMIGSSTYTHPADSVLGWFFRWPVPGGLMNVFVHPMSGIPTAEAQYFLAADSLLPSCRCMDSTNSASASRYRRTQRMKGLSAAGSALLRSREFWVLDPSPRYRATPPMNCASSRCLQRKLWQRAESPRFPRVVSTVYLWGSHAGCVVRYGP